VLPVGSLISDFAAGAGFIAASIAICGFIGQIKPTLTREEDQEIRVNAVIGGIVGLVFAAATILKSGSW
jgi:uncharacterized membrane protein